MKVLLLDILKVRIPLFCGLRNVHDFNGYERVFLLGNDIHLISGEITSISVGTWDMSHEIGRPRTYLR